MVGHCLHVCFPCHRFFCLYEILVRIRIYRNGFGFFSIAYCWQFNFKTKEEMIIWAIIFVLIILVVKLVSNYNLWLKHKQVNHSKEWVFMAVASIPSIIIFKNYCTLPILFSVSISGAMIAGFLWMCFDGLYNLLRGYGWWFTGSEDGKDDAKTDNFLQGLRLWEHITIKCVFLFIPLFIYLVNYKK